MPGLLRFTLFIVVARTSPEGDAASFHGFGLREANKSDILLTETLKSGAKQSGLCRLCSLMRLLGGRRMLRVVLRVR